MIARRAPSPISQRAGAPIAKPTRSRRPSPLRSTAGEDLAVRHRRRALSSCVALLGQPDARCAPRRRDQIERAVVVEIGDEQLRRLQATAWRTADHAATSPTVHVVLTARRLANDPCRRRARRRRSRRRRRCPRPSPRRRLRLAGGSRSRRRTAPACRFVETCSDPAPSTNTASGSASDRDRPRRTRAPPVDAGERLDASPRAVAVVPQHERRAHRRRPRRDRCRRPSRCRPPTHRTHRP